MVYFSVQLLGQFWMQFNINATNREVEAQLTEGTWVVSVSNGEIYEVPLAAIEGG